MKKKIAAVSITVLLTISSIFGCSSDNKQNDNENSNTTQDSTVSEKGSSSDLLDKSSNSAAAVTKITEEEYENEDFTRVLVSESGNNTSLTEDEVSILQSTNENTIYLKGDSVETSVQGTSIDNTILTISSPGSYIITGTLNDGQILVDCQETGTVELVFYNANISNSTNSPVFIKNCKKTLLVLAEDSVNSLNDASEYTYMDAENEEPSACLFSKDDLVICGVVSLTVNGNFNIGIDSKDTLKITGGTIEVTAENNGIKGKDCLMIAGGSFTVTSKGDGLKSDNSDTSLGYVSISDGTFTIISEEDAIQAESMLKVTGGTFDITTGNGAGTVVTKGAMPDENFMTRDREKGWDFDNQSSGTEDTTSMKGIKAGTEMIISDGTFDVDSRDDAFHSNGTFHMTGGTMLISTGDDGIHADDTLTVTDGDINITQCYEGIESPDIVFEGGTVHVKASDDGINAAGGEVTSSGSQNKMGMMSNSTGTLTINNGYIYINASGDGLDSNGDLMINGGTVIVEGPTDNGNSAIDYEYEFEINGGYLLASGSAGMVESVSSASKQNSVTAFFGSSVNANGIFAVLDSKGEMIMAFTPSKVSQCFIFSSSELESGETYTIVTGGSCDGTSKDGLYTEGKYMDGTELESFTVNESVTTVGSGGMGQNMGGPGGMKNHGGRRDFNGDEMGIPENMKEPPEISEEAEQPKEMEMPENIQNKAENLNNKAEIA